MARKEINIFGTSFLDLLSGALAAVIILFVVVPKDVQADPELVKQVQELKTVANNVKEAIEKIKNSVPKEAYEKIQDEIEVANKKLSELNDKIGRLEEGIKEISSENTALKEKVIQQQKDIEKLRQQIKELTETLKTEKEKNEKANSTANTVEETLGVFAKFGILCKWDETNTDVDMGVQKFGQPQEQCWRNYPSKKWGILGEDVRERVEEDAEERFELFYVPQIYPDEYTVWVNIYENSVSNYANVTCIFVFHPGKNDEIKKEVGPITISKGNNKLVATFRLSNSGFEFVSLKEPIWGTGKVIK